MKPVLIEFSKETGYPFQIWERDHKHPGYYHSYDVEYCKTYGELYADMNGGGTRTSLEWHDNKYWLADGEPLPVFYRTGEAEPAPAENRLTELPEQYQGDPDNWLEYDHCYYCAICDDYLPLNDGPCEHLLDCDECGAVSWPGERNCEHAPVELETVESAD